MSYSDHLIPLVCAVNNDLAGPPAARKLAREVLELRQSEAAAKALTDKLASLRAQLDLSRPPHLALDEALTRAGSAGVDFVSNASAKRRVKPLFQPEPSHTDYFLRVSPMADKASARQTDLVRKDPALRDAARRAAHIPAVGAVVRLVRPDADTRPFALYATLEITPDTPAVATTRVGTVGKVVCVRDVSPTAALCVVKVEHGFVVASSSQLKVFGWSARA